MEIRPVEIYSDHYAVMKHPGRRFPGVLVQGDSLFNLVATARIILQRAWKFKDLELIESAKELKEELNLRFMHYEAVLVKHGLPLPYVKPATLPDSLVGKAAFGNGEYSWRVDVFPNVLREAASIGLACLGGQFQFHRNDGPVCDIYYLAVDTGGRRQNETWNEYVLRSQREVEEGFEKIYQETDWQREAIEWGEYREGVDPRADLVFVAYFEKETLDAT